VCTPPSLALSQVDGEVAVARNKQRSHPTPVKSQAPLPHTHTPSVSVQIRKRVKNFTSVAGPGRARISLAQGQPLELLVGGAAFL